MRGLGLQRLQSQSVSFRSEKRIIEVNTPVEERTSSLPVITTTSSRRNRDLTEQSSQSVRNLPKI
jgi:hypothetical protein